MAKMDKKKKRLLLNLAFVFVLIVITLVVLFVSQKDDLDFNEIGNYFKNSNPVWIVAAFACMILFTFFEGVSIFFIARIFGSKPNIVSSTAYAAANGFYSLVTPTGAGGQPAAIFYMSRDGMSPGKASFAILLNTICYTGAIFAVGIAALCIDPTLFGGINTVFAKVLVVAGGVVQLVLLGLFIGCMYFGGAITKLGFGLVKILTKIKIVKKPDKWRAKIVDEVTKYRECRHILREKPLIILTGLFFNILQRVAQTMIPCFVCLAMDPNAPVLEIFALQAFVLFGYNATPLPGGVGAYEYLFMNIYGQMFPETSYILLILMISRLFSYYLSMIWSGVFTLTYHMVKVKKFPDKKAPAEGTADGASAGGGGDPSSGEPPDTDGGREDGAEKEEAVEETPADADKTEPKEEVKEEATEDKPRI